MPIATPAGTPAGTPTDGPAGAEGGREYALYVIDKHGNAVNAKTWLARPNRVMRPLATSPLPVSEIAAVEIRGVDGEPALLRASF